MRPFMASVAVIFSVNFTGPHILVVKGAVRTLFPAIGTGLWSRDLRDECTETKPRYNTAKDDLVRKI